MTSNSNSGGNNGEINSGNLRLDCSSAAGAPTLTTPTLTPTTLRNIEQMFLEASNGNNLEQPIVHENAAHFVPPSISMELPNIATTTTTGALAPPPFPGPSSNTAKLPPPFPGPSSNTVRVPPPFPGPSSNTVKVPPPLPGPHLLMPDILVSGPSPPKRPNVLKLSPPVPQVPLIVKSEPQEYLMQQPQRSTTNLSQTESTSTSSKTNRNNNNVIESLDTDTGVVNDDARRKELRRLRNKEAAARCRKRRLDQTTTLQIEVDKLEDIKDDLRQELETLQKEQDKLKGILDLHQCSFEEKAKMPSGSS